MRIFDGGSGIYFEDTGEGIPVDKREDVFDSGYTTGSAGIGIGLAIVEGVVQSHGWSISVTESAEEGSRFEITGVLVLEGVPSG